MTKCKSCNAVINPRWNNCLVCDLPVNKPIAGNSEEISSFSSQTPFVPGGHLATGFEALPKEHYTYYVLVAFDLLNQGQTISPSILLQHGLTKNWWHRFKEQYSDVLRWRDNGKDEYVGLE